MTTPDTPDWGNPSAGVFQLVKIAAALAVPDNGTSAPFDITPYASLLVSASIPAADVGKHAMTVFQYLDDPATPISAHDISLYAGLGTGASNYPTQVRIPIVGTQVKFSSWVAAGATGSLTVTAYGSNRPISKASSSPSGGQSHYTFTGPIPALSNVLMNRVVGHLFDSHTMTQESAFNYSLVSSNSDVGLGAVPGRRWCDINGQTVDEIWPGGAFSGAQGGVNIQSTTTPVAPLLGTWRPLLFNIESTAQTSFTYDLYITPVNT